MTPAAEAVGRRVYALGRANETAMQGGFDDRTVQSAANTLHALFAKKIEAMNIPGVKVEASFRLSGDEASYGEKGSARIDVIFVNPANGRTEGIWDWKVEGARLTPTRARELSERVSRVAGKPELPEYRIPVRELHVYLQPVPGAGP